MRRIFVGGTHAKGYDISNRKEPDKYITFPLWIGDECIGHTTYEFRKVFSNEEVDVYVEASITDQQALMLFLAAYMEQGGLAKKAKD